MAFGLYYLAFFSYGLRFLGVIRAKLIRLDKLIKGDLPFFASGFDTECLRFLLLVFAILLFYLRLIIRLV
jgi:hypothetical protein